MDGVEKGNYAHIKRAADGSLKEINFDNPIPGYPHYPKKDVKVDAEKRTVNGKTESQLEKEAMAERKEFVDAVVEAANRPLPHNEKEPLDQAQRTKLKTIEESLLSGNIDAIKKMFQSGQQNEEFWNRMSKEVGQDLPVTMFELKAGPSLQLVGEDEKGLTVIEIPAKGELKAYDWVDQTENRNLNEVISAQTMHRQNTGDKKAEDYKCDFDAHERAKAPKLGSVPFNIMVLKYNTYTKHLCGVDSED